MAADRDRLRSQLNITNSVRNTTDTASTEAVKPYDPSIDLEYTNGCITSLLTKLSESEAALIPRQDQNTSSNARTLNAPANLLALQASSKPLERDGMMNVSSANANHAISKISSKALRAI